MLRSVREESGSLDARPDSGVLLLATDDCLNVVLRSGEIDESEAGDIKLVPVPNEFGTSPNAWTLKRLHLDFRLTAAHECAANVTLPEGTYISCTAGGHLHCRDRGGKSTPFFYAIPPQLAFDWTAKRGEAVIGKRCTADNHPHAWDY
jgi:hypothetical protein